MRRILLSLALGLACAVSASAGTLPAVLNWSNPVDVTDSVQIEKAATCTGTFAVLKQVTPGTATYTDATNAPGDTPCYRIAYFNTSGIGPYAGPVSKTFPTVPASAPATFTVN